MGRNFLLTVCSAWITAVLCVSPVLAALDCQRCCQVLEPAAATHEPAACSHHADSSAKLPECCAGKLDAAETDRDEPATTAPVSCPTCPKCEAKRPVPAANVSVEPWKLPDPLATPLSLPVADQIAATSIFSGEREFLADADGPPLRVWHCVWRK